MQKALEVATGPEHIEDHLQVIVLASDGMGNVFASTQRTGWGGSGAEPACNLPASAEAIEFANQAKQAGMVVFTVAIGEDFLTHVMEAMASPDSDSGRPHFFTAENPAAMREIYDTLSERIEDFKECILIPSDSAAGGATVTVYKDGAQVDQTTADSAGTFTFCPVDPGTYTFSASVSRDGVTYDVLTNKVGGYELGSPPELEVLHAAGAYYIHLALKTDSPPQCQL